MKTDVYTKAVLTVIAACLVWMCVTRQVPVASAQVQPQPPSAQQQPAAPVRMILVDENNRPIYTTQGLMVNFGAVAAPVHVTNAAVPVQVTNPAVPVAVSAIQRAGTWDALQVRVLRDPPTLMPVP